jgi:2-C-methyl-D-erythritol 2,4-cyclodiphosphate synthase
LDVTDEATLVELNGGRVVMVPGSERNMKLTTREDIALAEAIAAAPSRVSSEIRTGIGYDVHRLVEGRPLVLGGVEIPSNRGLDGHSDADVLLHSICDAVLGACALGDIGQHFPPTDEAFRGIRSVVLLERIRAMVSDLGATVINIDATVIAEEPRLSPHSQAMREQIATALGISAGAVSVKATTNEGLGFAGRGEGIAAMAIATVCVPG